MTRKDFDLFSEILDSFVATIRKIWVQGRKAFDFLVRRAHLRADGVSVERWNEFVPSGEVDSWLDPKWFAILSPTPRTRPFESLAPAPQSFWSTSAGGNSVPVYDSAASGAHEELSIFSLSKFAHLSGRGLIHDGLQFYRQHLEPIHSRFNVLDDLADSGAPEEPESRYRPLISASIGTVLKCRPSPPLSQSWFSSRSTIRRYTAADDLCLNGCPGTLKASSPSRSSVVLWLNLASESECPIQAGRSAGAAHEDLAYKEPPILWIIKSGSGYFVINILV
ncbi:hypothetical protein RF11_14261 [Thelohanellus kitauei]|uniref:Uncharacterized protein n=1 Tax=Thelohanellus kitauei TaxID=669202 RepID=A0A0C2J990_THEKT|nr:hypothetical protein RF11_14261 [Thelohanellus kitauei]